MKYQKGYGDILFIGAVAIGLSVLAYFALQESKRERAEWEHFKTAHDCRKVSFQRSSSMPVTGFDTKGNATFSMVYVPSKTGYLCDDGITYVRED